MAVARINAAGQRVRLRIARDDDRPILQPVLAAAGRAGDSDELSVITGAGDDRPIGFITYHFAGPARGCVTIAWVALLESSRRWGLGQEAVRLFEEEAWRLWSVRRFRTEVAMQHGLALYFWLRLGYRPLVPRPAKTRRGCLPLVRDGSFAPAAEPRVE